MEFRHTNFSSPEINKFSVARTFSLWQLRATPLRDHYNHNTFEELMCSNCISVTNSETFFVCKYKKAEILFLHGE